MSRISLVLLLAVLVSGCGSEPKEEVMPFGLGSAPSIPLMQIDSVVSGPFGAELYLLDSMAFADNILIEEKLLYILAGASPDIFDADSVFAKIKMPNRSSGDINMTFPSWYLKRAHKMFELTGMQQVADKIFEIEKDQPHFLGGMNAELAHIQYGDQAVEKAFFGINSLDVWATYLNECVTPSNDGMIGAAHFMLIGYKKKVDNYKPAEKARALEFIELLEGFCDQPQ